VVFCFIIDHHITTKTRNNKYNSCVVRNHFVLKMHSVLMKRFCRAGTLRMGSPVSAISAAVSRQMCDAAARQLPPNLQLADLAVLEPPQEDIVKPIEYLFPQKSPPTSIQVHSFQNLDGVSVDSAPLDKRVFGVAIRQDIIHQIVRYQRAKIRQPQCTKGISEQRGSTRKLYAQKGSGRARVGMARVPGRRGGPKAHGPVLRDFSFSLNRKMRAMGMMIALAAKHREGNLIVFDKLECDVRHAAITPSPFHLHNLRTHLFYFLCNIIHFYCFDKCIDFENESIDKSTGAPWSFDKFDSVH
jgi:50S ribosomal protein L4